MKIIVLFFLVILLTKLLLNTYNYFRIKKLKQYYEEFLRSKRKNMCEFKNEVLELFKKANVEDASIPVAEHISRSQVMNGMVSIFSMFPTIRPNFAAETLNMFDCAIGSFRKNIVDCINPIFWLDLIVNFPKHIIDYLGFDEKSKATKAIKLLSTFIWWLIAAGLILFKSQIQSFIIEQVGNF